MARTLKENVDMLEGYNDRLQEVADGIRNLIENPPAETSEMLEIHFKSEDGNPYAGGKATVRYMENDYPLTAGSDGKCSIEIPAGAHYRVTIAKVDGLYVRNRHYVYEYDAVQQKRVLLVQYHSVQTGLFIVAQDGREFTFEEWKSSGRNPEDAKMVKIVTKELVENNGVFGILLDHIALRNYGANQMWASAQVEFKSIPLNGNAADQPYYYDGLTATQLVIQEGDEQNVGTPAADKCWGMKTIFDDAVEHQGFLGTTCQWQIVKNNSEAIDEILLYVRPNATYTLASLWSQFKWTITQYSAAYSWGFVSSPGYGHHKTNSTIVLPFYAF